jgi:hypothetical protein
VDVLPVNVASGSGLPTELYSCTPPPSEHTQVACAKHVAGQTEERGEEGICHNTHDAAEQTDQEITDSQ